MNIALRRSFAMTLFLLRLAVAFQIFAFLLATGAAEEQTPTDVLKTCKNEVGARYLNIPMAYISVDRGAKTANGNYLVNWTTKPPAGAASAGWCVVDPSFNVLRFETTSGPKPEVKPTTVSPEDALRLCKDEAAHRLRIVPMEDITVERGKDLADGSYVVQWKETARGGVGRSGSCVIAADGKLSKFQFDSPAAKPPGSVHASDPAH